MEGYLLKKGRGKTISLFRPWASRYFILFPGTSELVYYTEKNGFETLINNNIN